MINSMSWHLVSDQVSVFWLFGAIVVCRRRDLIGKVNKEGPRATWEAAEDWY